MNKETPIINPEVQHAIEQSHDQTKTAFANLSEIYLIQHPTKTGEQNVQKSYINEYKFNNLIY